MTDDGRYDVAMRLASLADRGYVMATSEAGLLPFYSGWKSVDTWGLNDVTIAHERRLTPAYLDRYRPHLIMFHAHFAPDYQPSRPSPDAWEEMCLVLRDYATEHGYQLAALWGKCYRIFTTIMFAPISKTPSGSPALCRSSRITGGTMAGLHITLRHNWGVVPLSTVERNNRASRRGRLF